MTEEMKRGANRLHRDEQTVKNRKKLYKNGKLWSVMGITTFVGATMFVTNVKASTSTITDDQNVSVAATATTSGNSEVTLKTSVSTKDNQPDSKINSITNNTDAAQLPSDSTADESTSISPVTDSNNETAIADNAQAVSDTTQSETSLKVTALGADASDAQLSDAKNAATGDYQKTGTPQMITVVAPAAEIATGVDGTANWDIDQDGNLQIHAGTLSNQKTWLNNAADIKSIKTDSGVIASSNSNDNNTDTNHLFGDLPNVKTIDLTGLDTSQMTNMTHLFASDPNLESIVFDPTKFDTSNVTDFSRMFWGDSKLTELDVSHFNTSNGAIFYGMFEGANSLTSIDVSNFDTSKATNMQQMFTDTWALKQIDVSKFDTSHVTTMNSMFERAGKDASVTPTDPLVLDVSHWKVDNVTDFWGMFDQSTIQKLDVSHWNMGNAANTSNWLNQMPNLWSLKLGPNVKLTDSGLNEVPIAQTALPDQSKDDLGSPNTTVNASSLNDANTGWQAVSGGDEHNPEGTTYLANTLIGMYPGNGTGNTEEYVWSQAVINCLQFIDVDTGKEVTADFNGRNTYATHGYGDVVNTNTDDLTKANDIPAGYHFATASELKNGQVQPSDTTKIGPNLTKIKMYVAKDVVLTNYLRFIDVNNGQVVPGAEFYDYSYKFPVGTYLNTKVSAVVLPKGYHFATTNELKSGQVQPADSTLIGPDGTVIKMYVAPTVSMPDENKQVTVLNINYLDKDDNSIRPSDVETGEQGTKLEIEAPEIPGYVLTDSSQVKTPVTLQGNLMTLTLHYNLESGQIPDENEEPTTLNVNYVDQDGNLIRSSEVHTGKQSVQLIIEAPEISGYELTDNNQAKTSVTLQGNLMTLTLNYKLKIGQVPDEGNQPAILNVNYVDENDNQLRNSDVQVGDQGAQFEIVAPSIPGYELADDSQSRTPVTLQGSAMTLTLIYKPQAATGTPGTPTPITSNTPTPTPETTQTPSTSVETTMVPEGDTTPSNSNQGQVIQLKQPTSTSEEPSQSQSRGQATKAINTTTPVKSNVTTAAAHNAQKQTLPQADESTNQGILSLLGITLLGFLGLWTKKRKQD